MKNFNPRHLRKKFAKKSGDSGIDKARAFRRCKMISDKYIHLSADALASPQVAPGYAKYCDRTRNGGGLR